MSNQENAPPPLCLIGEADPFLAQLLQRFAERSGLYVRIAQSGEAVWDIARQERPALIIIEPELPGKVRGWQAVMRLKNSADTREIPVILCAWLEQGDSRGLVGHALEHLQKPELHYTDFQQALAAAGVRLST